MDKLDGLARSARNGDPDDVERFARAAYPMVWRLCAALVDRESADDLTQEAILEAVRSLHRYRGEARASTWLLAIARHTCIDELRSMSRRKTGTTVDPATLANAASEDPYQELVVADLLRHLDPDRRAAFVLTQILGLAYQEAAEVCGCPTGTIRSRVARSRRDLIALIASDESLQCDVGETPGADASA